MPKRHPHRAVEDFTVPFLVSAGVLSFMALFVVWAIFGYLAALFSGWVVNQIIGLKFPRSENH